MSILTRGSGGRDYVTMLTMRLRLEALEGNKRRGARQQDQEPLAAEAATLIARNGMLSRPQVAAYLQVSSRTIQRWEAAGILKRCPGLGMVVRYAARDVLRLASAR